jgi:putative acetyltransferase
MAITIERVTEATTELGELIQELEAVLGAEYEPHQRHGLAIAQLFEPHMRFFIARIGGAPAGCGGVALFDGYAEVKRMYTRPAARGRGVAKALLARIEDEARAADAANLCLETGTRQHAAIGLYLGMGFRPCDSFGAYSAMRPEQIAESLFYEKPL